MKDVILTIKTEFKLFKQPRHIGDTFEFNDKYYLVIGIENFTVFGSILTVWYTCQDLGKIDYISKKKTLEDHPDSMLAEVKFKYDDERLRQRFLGSTHEVNGQFYKIMEYRDINVMGTDIQLVFSTNPIYPIGRKEAKAKSLHEKKKKLQLEIF